MPLIGVFLIVVKHNAFLFFDKSVSIFEEFVDAFDGLLDARVKVILDMVVAPATEAAFPQFGANLAPLLWVLPK